MLNSSNSQNIENTIQQAYERNMIAYTAALAGAGGGYVQYDPDVVLTIFPYTFWSNGVISPRFGADNVLERINAVLAVFRSYKREVWFHVGPSSSPLDLVKHLKARGLWNFHNRPFMVSKLDNLPADSKSPEGVKISCV